MLNDIISIARIHANSCQSSMICFNDAVSLISKGDTKNAVIRAMKSLRYSVGIFNEDYKTADSFAKKMNFQ